LPAMVADAADDSGHAPVLAVPKMLQEYFSGSGMSLQEYFKFPEMKQIKNPVHEYFNLKGECLSKNWIEAGTLALEEGDEGWVLLGPEHQELARIAVTKSGSRHYLAVDWDGSYIGPLLRSGAAVVSTGTTVVCSTVHVTSYVVRGVASMVYTPSPPIPPADASLQDRFVEEEIELDGHVWFFRVWLPPDLQARRKESGEAPPLFLLLHGFKECGWDNWWQTNSGLALHLQTAWWAKWFPGIVVLPQLPRRPWDEQWWEHWRNPAMSEMALACAEKAANKYYVDRKRIYLVGESLGTEGAWHVAAARPSLFAAVAGSCGSVEPYDWQNWEWGSSPESFAKLADAIGVNVPMWFCHGRSDDFVPIEQSRKFYAALQERRQRTGVSLFSKSQAAEVVFREYEDMDHHVWDRAYTEDRVIEWLLKHRKP